MRFTERKQWRKQADKAAVIKESERCSFSEEMLRASSLLERHLAVGLGDRCVCLQSSHRPEQRGKYELLDEQERQLHILVQYPLPTWGSLVFEKGPSVAGY